MTNSFITDPLTSETSNLTMLYVHFLSQFSNHSPSETNFKILKHGQNNPDILQVCDKNFENGTPIN